MARVKEPEDARARGGAHVAAPEWALRPLTDLREASRAGADRIAHVLSVAVLPAEFEPPPEFNAYHSIVEFERGAPITGYSRTPEDAMRELDELVARAFQFDVARAVAGTYHGRFPGFETLTRTHAHLNGPGSGRAGEWLNDYGREVDVATRPGARTSVIVFCGLGRKFGFPLNVLWHLWLSAYSVNMIVVHDRQGVIYLSGIGPFGSLKESVAGLLQMSRSLGAERIVTMGNSAGGSGALLYGTLLGAERCLAFSPPLRFPRPTKVRERENTRTRLLSFREQGRIDWPDARATLEASPMKADIFFSDQIRRDKYQAETASGLPNVTLHAVSGVKGHTQVMKTLIEQGTFKALLDDVLGPVEAPA